MNRTLIVGDIHGGLKALKQVLERVELKPTDHLMFLGDYVDGWSESAQVINYLLKLNEEYHCDFIYGNHDAWCAEWLKTDKTNSLWLKHGGQFTLDSYQNISKEEKEIHLQFFSKMKNFIIDSQKRLFIHAGFSSMHGPDREHYHTNYSWDRTLWETALALHGKISKDDPHYPKRLRLFKEIFIGHTPTTEWGETRPWNRMNVWNVDTGAAFKGRLSVLDLDTKQQWQSDKLPSLYPLEKGRN